MHDAGTEWPYVDRRGETSGHFWGIPISLTQRVGLREKAEFCTQLAVMLQARVSLQRALEVLAHQTRNVRTKHIIERLCREIGRGHSFARALEQEPQMFDRLFVTTAEVGEESGRLPEVLGRLAEHIEKSGALRRKFLQAMSYPILVLGVAVCAVTFLLTVIVPTFADMFRNFQIDLPASTQLVLGISGWLAEYSVVVLVTALGLLFLMRMLVSSARMRERMEVYCWKVPLIGEILRKNHVAHVCRTLGTLLGARVSLMEALRVTQRTIAGEQIRMEVGQILKDVQRGKGVAEPLSESVLFPAMVAQMIAVGEETSELDSMLIKVANHYEREVGAAVDTLATLLEPILVIVLGLIVGGILVSMYLPLFDLMTVVGAMG